MDAKTARELSLKVSNERQVPILNFNYDSIKVLVSNNAKSGFRAAFYREKVPSFILETLIKKLKSEGYTTEPVELPEEPNNFNILVQW